MPVRGACHWLLLFTLFTSVPAGAAGLEDADERLFRVQLSVAEKGDARAQYYLGEMHEQGLGTKQNIQEAFKWYAKAAKQGDAFAKRKLTLRSEIEAEIKKDQAAPNFNKDQATETKVSVPSPKKQQNPDTVVSNKSDKKPSVAVMQDSEREIYEERIKKAEKEKRRAQVRALILERMRNPTPGLFE